MFCPFPSGHGSTTLSADCFGGTPGFHRRTPSNRVDALPAILERSRINFRSASLFAIMLVKVLDRARGISLTVTVVLEQYRCSSNDADTT